MSSFDRQDADRLLFFCSNQCKDQDIQNGPYAHLSRWLASLTKDRITGSLESKQISSGTNGVTEDRKHLTEGSYLSSLKPRLKPATMRPIPRSPKQQMHLFMGLPQSIIHDASQVKPTLPAPPVKHIVVPVVPATQRKSSSGPRVPPSVPLNPLPMKKHGCNRLPIRICSEVHFWTILFPLLCCYMFLAISHIFLWYLLQGDFLKDVMQFLLQRGHIRLIPQGGLAEFPDAVLNTKRLDLYNLYKEVIAHFCCSLVWGKLNALY